MSESDQPELPGFPIRPGGGDPPPDSGGTPGYGPPQGYGPPPGYGRAQGYGPPQGYGAPPGYPPYGAGPAVGRYADWLHRAGSYLIDAFIVSIPGAIGLLIFVLTSDQTLQPDGTVTTQTSNAGLTSLLLGYLLTFALFLWNSCLRQGRTGQSVGKQVLGTRLLRESTGQPIGGGMAFLRYLLHTVDAIPCYLGFLWPLWDPKRQTFADKIVNTVVVKA